MGNVFKEAISKLNPIDDALLIGLLEEKARDTEYNTLITDKHLTYVKSGSFVSLMNYQKRLLSERTSYTKAEIVLSKSSCERCHLSVQRTSFVAELKKDVTVKVYDRTNPICTKCWKKHEIAYDIVYGGIKKAEDANHSVLNSDFGKDVLKCKYLISQITKKLKNYDASKH